jgi:nucleoside-diphosphate-sugar epimerase
MTPSERSKEEDELLKLYPGDSVTVLNLSGLWGGERLPKNWVGKVAATKEMLQSKGSLHLIHGYDVARAIIAAHKQFGKANGQRWILTDMRCYDWWDLAAVWSSSSSNEDRDDGIREQEDARPQANWVRELLLEQGIRGLPRNVELLGRALDSRDFWEIFGLNPLCYIK